MRRLLGTVIQAGKGILGKITGSGASKADNLTGTLQGTGQFSDDQLKIINANAKSIHARSTITNLALGGGVVAAGAEFVANGKEGLIGGAVDAGYTELGKLEANQNTAGKWQGLFRHLQEFLALFGIESEWLNERIENHAKKDSAFTRTTEAITDNPGATAAIAGTTVVAGLAAKKMWNGRGGADGTAAKGVNGQMLTKAGAATEAIATSPKQTTALGSSTVADAPRTSKVQLSQSFADHVAQGDVLPEKPGLFKRIISSGVINNRFTRKLPLGVGAALTATSMATMSASAAEAAEMAEGAETPEMKASFEQVTADAETQLGGETIAGVAATGAGLATTFALASNPVGWAIAGSIGVSVAVGVATKFVADKVTVDDKGTSLSQWTGNKLSNAWSRVSDVFDGNDQKPVEAIPVAHYANNFQIGG